MLSYLPPADQPGPLRRTRRTQRNPGPAREPAASPDAGPLFASGRRPLRSCAPAPAARATLSRQARATVADRHTRRRAADGRAFVIVRHVQEA